MVDDTTVALKPEIADALRDLHDQIGDFDSAVAEFHLPPIDDDLTIGEPERDDSARGEEDGTEHAAPPESTAALRPIAVAVLGGLAVGAAVVAAGIVGPLVADWVETSEPAPTLALVEDEAEPTQRVVVDGDTMYLEGLVPDQAVSDVLESAAVEAIGRERVVNNFEISPRAVYDPERPIRITTAEPVLFTSGVAAIDARYRPLIDIAVELMRAEPTSTLAITGHTDDIGSPRSNLRLSIARAESVARLVVEHGIARERLTISGRGEADPIDTNETPQGRATNRRVEFSILGVFDR